MSIHLKLGWLALPLARDIRRLLTAFASLFRTEHARPD